MALKTENRHTTPLALAGEIEVWLAEVSYRSDQERALREAQRLTGPTKHRASAEPVWPRDARRGYALADAGA